MKFSNKEWDISFIRCKCKTNNLFNLYLYLRLSSGRKSRRVVDYDSIFVPFYTIGVHSECISRAIKKIK